MTNGLVRQNVSLLPAIVWNVNTPDLTSMRCPRGVARRTLSFREQFGRFRNTQLSLGAHQNPHFRTEM
jgi:hypothetical protein